MPAPMPSNDTRCAHGSSRVEHVCEDRVVDGHGGVHEARRVREPLGVERHGVQAERLRAVEVRPGICVAAGAVIRERERAQR